MAECSCQIVRCCHNFLYLANRGVDVIRIDAVPYIWKEIGTCCRNLPQVHTIVRMMRLIGQIVCPSVILLGESVNPGEGSPSPGFLRSNGPLFSWRAM